MTLTFGYTITNATEQDLAALLDALRKNGHTGLAWAIEAGDGERAVMVTDEPRMTPEGVATFNGVRAVSYSVRRVA